MVVAVLIFGAGEIVCDTKLLLELLVVYMVSKREETSYLGRSTVSKALVDIKWDVALAWSL